MEADGIQLLRRVEGGEQTGAVTETEKKEIDDLSRRAFFFRSLGHLLIILFKRYPASVSVKSRYFLSLRAFLKKKKNCTSGRE